jgi:hypothetical protein
MFLDMFLELFVDCSIGKFCVASYVKQITVPSLWHVIVHCLVGETFSLGVLFFIVG